MKTCNWANKRMFTDVLYTHKHKWKSHVHTHIHNMFVLRVCGRILVASLKYKWIFGCFSLCYCRIRLCTLSVSNVCCFEHKNKTKLCNTASCLNNSFRFILCLNSWIQHFGNRSNGTTDIQSTSQSVICNHHNAIYLDACINSSQQHRLYFNV